MQYAGGNLIAICACFVVFDTFFILARVVSRKVLSKVPWGMDDVFAIAGYFACIAMCAVGFCFVIYGKVGYTVEQAVTLSPDAMENWAKLIIALEVVYTTAVSLTKLSMLCLFYRVFSTRRYRIAIVTLMVLVVMVWLAIMLAGVLECIPTAHFWDKSKPGKCFNTEDYFKWGPLPGVVVDLLILTLPLTGVWRLQASTGRKIGLTIMFLLGSLGLLACIARNALFWLHSAYTDPTYSSWFLVGISVIEPSFYLIACCFVAMKPFGKFVFERTVSEKWQTSLNSFLHSTSSSNRRAPYDQTPPRPSNYSNETTTSRDSWDRLNLTGMPSAYVAEVKYGNYKDRDYLEDDVEVRRDLWIEESYVQTKEMS